MKCIDNQGDRKADAVVRAGGQPCDEYGTHLASDGAICTWVPVNHGQKIVIETGFAGMTKEIQIDLVVDGVLRNSEKTTRKAEKKDRKSERFEHGFYAQSKSVINEAELEIKALDVSSYPSIQVEGKDSVGIIEVRISILREEYEEYHKLDDVKSFETIMDWKEAYRTPSYTKIRPVQQVDFIPIDQQPTKVQITKLKQRASGRRPGTKPWVVFRFYYRPQEAINSEGLTKANSKTVIKFDAPPLTKNADQTATAPGPPNASSLAGTASATTAKDTSTSTTEAPSTKAATVQKPSSKKAASAHTAAESPDDTKNATNDATSANEPPVEGPKDGITQPIVSKTDLGSEQPDLVSENASSSMPSYELECSTIRSTAEHLELSSIKESSAMTSIPDQPTLAADILEVAPERVVSEYQQSPSTMMVDVAAEVPTEEMQQAPAAGDDTTTGQDFARKDTPQPSSSQALAAKMVPDSEADTNEILLSSSPKDAVQVSTVAKVPAVVTPTFNVSQSLETIPVADLNPAINKSEPEVLQEVGKQVKGSVVQTMAPKTEPMEANTPKFIEKVKIEPGKGSLKRAFSATPTPDPATKRLKLENGELEKRLAEKKKALAEKRASRIKSQNKASEAQKKAASAEARRKEALEKMLAEMEDEIAEEERLAQEAEEQLEASEATMEETAQEGSENEEI
ncbi:hypothetical protein FKW77_000038 [Venturia effusa]|uniref:Uncharacterized protein n=1 Tax=Venturia effusa TaxID=50376 RepID=A0A517LA58_9PEZI|nr:hypothetical protein FKW77_000038 [Venturia effusa]